MDTYEATKEVMSRIQSLDPENASKIMGYILIQDQGEKEMIRLAFVPESLLLSYINQAKLRLGISSNPMRPNNPFPLSSPRISIPNNGFHLNSNPSSPAAACPRPFSYAAALNGASNGNSPSDAPSSLHFYGAGSPFFDDSMVDPIMSPSGRSDSLVFPYGEDANGLPSPHSHPFHRRSCSVNDAAAFLEDGGGGGGFGWRPCMYFARGFCKNGSACKFLHSDNGGGGGGGEAIDNSSHGFDDLLRMKALHHQRLALMASRAHHPLAYNKCMDFLNENPRNELSPMGLGGGASSSSSCQIYLTFPADSTFKEEDVSNYFSMYGPVQDVRIPYQQKRMFGFVTFVYPETVKLILAKRNPHFVCDSRVLVKPYKEKGKIPEKKQHLDLSPPSGIESREHIDRSFGSRMLFSTQEMMLRRKMEQEAELQHAIELQNRRMMNLQLMDLKNQQHFLQSLRAGVPISSPRQSQLQMNHNFIAASDAMTHENSEDFDGRQEAAKSPRLDADQNMVVEGTQSSLNKQQNMNGVDADFSESMEHVLPENLFASPTKSAAERHSVFPASSSTSDDNDTIPLITTSSNNNTPAMPLAIPSLKACYIQMPRFSSGREAIEM